MTEPKHIPQWRVMTRGQKDYAKLVDEYIASQRPKQIVTKTENGLTIKVYEGR